MAALAKASGTIVPIPPGWETSTQLGERWGITQCEACRQLKKMMRLGWFEMRKFAMQTTGGVRMIQHYRMTKKCPL